jgi:hypothetical protein
MCWLIDIGCYGTRHSGIAVKENRNRMKNNLNKLPFLPGKLSIVENYLEAVGVMQTLRAGVALDTIRRPIEYTKVKLAESKAARPDDLVGREDFANNNIWGR